MTDPSRLRSKAGSLEALLLRSAPRVEPPASAEEEIWRRLQAVSAVGAAAGVTGIAARAAASGASKMVGKAMWPSVLKWGAIVAIGVPAASIAGRALIHRAPGETQAANAKTPSIVVEPATGGAVGGLPHDSNTTGAPAERAAVDIPKLGSSQRTAHNGGHAESITMDAPSALRAESLLLGVARAKVAAGDYRGALDDLARLGVQFPHGRLVQEREVLAIDCLAAMGNRPGMRTRALAFLERFPDSPYSSHLGRLLEP
jgi:hypothetical protein